jgi:DNA-directed RNA polymerase specialized sigma24 family protein
LIEKRGAEKSDERLELMRQAISRLPETQREPLLLKLQQELSPTT